MASNRSSSLQINEQPSEAPPTITTSAISTASSPTASSNDQENETQLTDSDEAVAQALMRINQSATPSTRRDLTAENIAAMPPGQIPIPLWHPPEPRAPLREVMLEQEEIRSEAPEERSSDVPYEQSSSLQDAVIRPPRRDRIIKEFGQDVVKFNSKIADKALPDVPRDATIDNNNARDLINEDTAACQYFATQRKQYDEVLELMRQNEAVVQERRELAIEREELARRTDEVRIREYRVGFAERELVRRGRDVEGVRTNATATGVEEGLWAVQEEEDESGSISNFGLDLAEETSFNFEAALSS
ncbi:hypothetical protein B0A48_17304 [Cryoendolithus antarcticus]|uniref:Uncharacterized protein n=1 Tax=Cryoendolithus antarcticus TaxID=1507870 RepID=A0A1V8SBU0_9PEZI|nr:hypothetical protein B0A48_17304 [Cryoendolithus antarcticus]